MTMAQDIPVLASVEARSIGREAWGRLLKGKLSRLCLIIVAVYVAVGLMSFLPLAASKISDQISADKTYAPPAFFFWRPDGTRTISPARWFGLDFEGRSVLWRTAYGTRVALLIMVCTCVLTTTIGTVLGLLGGYLGGWVDDLITWLYSTVASIPWLLLVIALAYVLQNVQLNVQMQNPESRVAHIAEALGGLPIVVLSLGLTDWVTLCRLIRGEVIKLRDQDFVTAARALGLGGRRIAFGHILPNTFHIVIITFSLSAVNYVQAEVVLAFLGLGINVKEPSWGRMIDDSKLELLRGVWWEFAAATAAIFIISLALNTLGDALRDALDPKLHGVK
jgi:peptide/nickel transport system permease protein